MNEPSRRESVKASRAWHLWLIGSFAVLVFISLVVWTRRPPLPQANQPNSAGAKSFPLPTISESPFLNTKPDVAYVGSEACRTCHADHDAAFRHTGMGRSMADVDLTREPPDGEFEHPVSKRRYEVRRHDGQLWHRELLLVDDPAEVLLAEYPVKFVIGSGHHSLTYLVEVDGFLVESPLTWYMSRKAWGMSPGYDVAEHSGFERATGEGCLTCHASRAEALDKSLHRMHIFEAAIGCERCHGPGELHVEKHRERTAAADSQTELDRTIVNPSHLSRELSEAVCQQCHLRSTATILTRGRQISDFRPGLRLQEFRTDFWLDVPDKPMTVVGHVEQLHLSRCYQKSNKLTCLTCHAPHDVGGEQKSKPHQAICLSCHRPEHCREEVSQRRKLSPDNDCVQCHMPSSNTEIPHLAFTHHRIGVHQPVAKSSVAGPSPASRPGVLRPFLMESWPSELDQQRTFGLAYLEAANRESQPDLADQYRQRALDLLTNARTTGLRDPMLDAALARLHFELEIPGTQSLAESTLSQKGLDGQDRSNALFLLADSHFQAGRWKEAVATLQQLTRLRRHHVDWLLLAECEQRMEHPEAVQLALLTATRINPRLWRVHQALAERFAKAGEQQQADWHKRRAIP
ncbi:MAG: hypothetical protein FJ302_11140 [Planctomycetes bacterium]|nr:hypothetical protein [Planctomycetota bacterium]